MNTNSMSNEIFTYTNYKKVTYILGVQLKKVTWPNREAVPYFLNARKFSVNKKNNGTHISNSKIIAFFDILSYEFYDVLETWYCT